MLAEKKLPEHQSVLVLTGPTGSGKSQLAHYFARRRDLDLINGDSVQVYKNFDIGSAKPSDDEIGDLRYHLLSVVEPGEKFDAVSFASRAKKAIKEVCSRGRRPLIVGGSGLYLRALLNGLLSSAEPAAAAYEKLRQLEEIVSKDDSKTLYDVLLEEDPVTAGVIHPSDLYRIRRALLFLFSGGESLAVAREIHSGGQVNYRSLVICILPDRAQLYQHLNQRTEQMLKDGLVAEVQALRECYPDNSPPFRSLGYKEVISYLKGEINYNRMVYLIKRDTRHYAKRQYTWWRNQPSRLNWRTVQIDKFVEKERGEQLELLEHEISVFFNNGSVYKDKKVYYLPLESFSFSTK